MITASHNPSNYNGLKIYSKKSGGQVWGEQIFEIGQLAQKQIFEHQSKNKFFSVKPDLKAKKAYLKIIKSVFLPTVWSFDQTVDTSYIFTEFVKH